MWVSASVAHVWRYKNLIITITIITCNHDSLQRVVCLLRMFYCGFATGLLVYIIVISNILPFRFFLDTVYIIRVVKHETVINSQHRHNQSSHSLTIVRSASKQKTARVKFTCQQYIYERIIQLTICMHISLNCSISSATHLLTSSFALSPS